jgi:hypothetical protein
MVFVTTKVDDKVQPYPRAGLAPLTARLEYAFSGAAQSVSLDFGDGSPAYSGGADTPLPPHAYSQPGWYFPKLRVTDAQGAAHQAETVILAEDGAAADARFTELWNGMNNALLSGDKATALQFLNAGAQRKYGPVFDVLMPHFGEIVASYSALARSSVAEEIAEYAIARPFEGKKRLFLVYFLKGKDGVWRINAM